MGLSMDRVEPHEQLRQTDCPVKSDAIDGNTFFQKGHTSEIDLHTIAMTGRSLCNE
jgi:hypothetical protein